MAMSTSIIGFRPPDERWAKMKNIWDACKIAGEEVPNSVEKFFDFEPPDERGISVDLINHPCTRPHGEPDEEGFEVELAKLPTEVTHIRFLNSYS